MEQSRKKEIVKPREEGNGIKIIEFTKTRADSKTPELIRLRRETASDPYQERKYGVMTYLTDGFSVLRTVYANILGNILEMIKHSGNIINLPTLTRDENLNCFVITNRFKFKPVSQGHAHTWWRG